MMAPKYYREARMEARDHIQGRVLERRGSRLRVKIEKVFRGDLRRGTELMLHVSLADDGPVELGGQIAVREDVVDAAPFVEAFLDGDPPDVVRDQIKFLPGLTGRPSGDPERESFLW